MPKTARQRQLDAAAEEVLSVALGYGGEGGDSRPLADIARTLNDRQEGWTLNTAGIGGHVIRHEAVTFTASELDTLAALAQQRLDTVKRGSGAG